MDGTQFCLNLGVALYCLIWAVLRAIISAETGGLTDNAGYYFIWLCCHCVVLPVWSVTAARLYQRSATVYGLIFICGLLLGPDMTAPAFHHLPENTPSMLPCCLSPSAGDISGFRLVASGTTSKQLDKENDLRLWVTSVQLVKARSHYDYRMCWLCDIADWEAAAPSARYVAAFVKVANIIGKVGLDNKIAETFLR